MKRPIPFVLGFCCLIGSAGFIVSPKVRSSPVAVAAGVWAYSWVALCLIGAVATIYGWSTRREEFEVLGLTFTGFGGIAYVFGVFATRGLTGWFGSWYILGAALGHLLRANELRHLRRYP